jgi:hypothetical protein
MPKEYFGYDVNYKTVKELVDETQSTRATMNDVVSFIRRQSFTNIEGINSYPEKVLTADTLYDSIRFLFSEVIEPLKTNLQIRINDNNILNRELCAVKLSADNSIKQLRENENNLHNQLQKVIDELDDAKLRIELYTKLLNKLSEE